MNNFCNTGFIISGILIKNLGSKHTIMLGLLFEMLQLFWYGFGTTTWMMWGAGILASMSSITYPAISAFVSVHSTPDRQGVVQGTWKKFYKISSNNFRNVFFNTGF